MNVKTLGQFIIEKQSDFPYAKGELSRLLRDIGIAAKIVNRDVNKAGLIDILGETGDTNVQGERVKKLDVFANDQFKLNSKERAALSNFDKYRIQVLNSQTDEEKFHYQYRQLQVIANLSDWQEFLTEDFAR